MKTSVQDSASLQSSLQEVRKVKEYIKKNNIQTSERLFKTLVNIAELDFSDEDALRDELDSFYDEHDYYNEYELIKSKYLHQGSGKKIDSTTQLDEHGSLNRYFTEEKIHNFLKENTHEDIENFFIEEGIVYTVSPGKVFKIEGEGLEYLGKHYNTILKVGKYYFGEKEKLGGKTYYLINPTGEDIDVFGYPQEEKFAGNSIYHTINPNTGAQYFYDEDMELCCKDLPSNIQLAYHKNGEWLFNDNKGDGWFILQNGKERDGEFVSEDEIENSKCYQAWIAEKQALAEEAGKQQKSIDKLSFDYDIIWNGSGCFVEKIVGKKGNLIFENNDERLKYAFAYPDSFYQSSLNRNYDEHKNILNKGYLILHGHDLKVEKSAFVNTNTGTVLYFEKNPKSVTIEGDVVLHYVDENDAEVYSADGELLGIKRKDESLKEEDTFIKITNNNWKEQLIELSTGKIIEQEFDKILKIYEYEDRKDVIVENDGKALLISISKN